MDTHYYLAKSEPETRLEQGVDISFPLSRLASSSTKRTTWEGVRNPIAGKNLKNMKVGDKLLFYHSNCKLPGVAGEVEVCTEPRPDETAWDPSHPYFDPKTDKTKPRWYMPEVEYRSTFSHFVPLSLLQHLSQPTLDAAQRSRISYLSDEAIKAISQMDLLRQGRLSVQSVSLEAFEAVKTLGEKGGWAEWPGKWQVKAAGAAKRSRSEADTVDGRGEAAATKTGKSTAKQPRKSTSSSTNGSTEASTSADRQARDGRQLRRGRSAQRPS